jgi:DNA polymerase-3 subunit delta'
MGWDRVRGHADARERLTTAFSAGRLGHGFLFVGPAGVGKHTFAAAFAQALLCERPAGPLEPCGRCPGCVQARAGTHPDLFLVRTPDDKHELPVEDMQAFCASLGRKASRGGRKVGVVESADEFNEASANCFLKTLEEPPAGTVLVLLGESAEAQLPTIRSRCQTVRFHPLADADVRAVLLDHGVPPDRLDRLVPLAAGRPGLALALADEAVWAFRDALTGLLTAAKPDAPQLAAELTRFAESAGKESAAQRARAGVAVRLAVDVLRAALRASVGGPADPAVARLGERLGPDKLADSLDACHTADRLIDRRVQLVLVAEQLADRLAG